MHLKSLLNLYFFYVLSAQATETPSNPVGKQTAWEPS